VKEALDLCLSCKACKSECPVNVDMATYKAEFLAHYYQGHHRHLRDYAFGFMDKWARLASLIPGVTPQIANLPLRMPGVRGAMKAVLGIAPERRLPEFAARSFQSACREQGSGNRDRSRAVLLWPDTWNNYFHPQNLAAGREVLASAGFDVQVPRGHVCCGRPLYDFGFLAEAREYLGDVMDKLGPAIDAGIPVVFLEPSCASVFRDELRNFFPEDERAKRLRAQSFLLADFLVTHAPDFRPPWLEGRSVVLHGHCHVKSQTKMKAEVALLKRGGAQVTVLDSGCCGMAGPFGFEKEKFTVSQALAERALLPAVRWAEPDQLIVVDGFSCREQIAQNSTRSVLHLAQVLRGIR
jgi:Fe-S oxidoreductase